MRVASSGARGAVPVLGLSAGLHRRASSVLAHGALAGAEPARSGLGPRTQPSPIGSRGYSNTLSVPYTPSRTQRPSRSTAAISAAIGGGSGSRRRALIRRRPQPRGSARRRRRYRDEAGLIPDLDPDSPRFPGRLTTEVGSANGPLQVAALLAEYGTRMSGPQVALALGRLAAFASFQALTFEQRAAHRRAARRCCLLLLQPGLGPGGGGSSTGGGLPGLAVVSGGACGAVGGSGPRPRLSECEPLSLARAAYALGRLGLYDRQLLDLLVQESGSRLHLFPADALAALLGGLTAVGHMPPADWWGRFSLEVYARFGLFNCQELAVLLYGCARLSYAPSPAWAARCLEAYRAAAAAPYAPPLPAAGVKFAFALASLQIRPSFNWLAAFLARARPHLDALSARELAVLLWAMSRLLLPPPPPPPPTRTTPAPAFTAAAQQQQQQQQQQQDAADAANMRESSNAAGSSTITSSSNSSSITHSSSTTSTSTSSSTGSYLPLLDRVWLDAWLRCTARRLPGASAAALVLAAQALAVLQVYPLPSKFSAALLDRLAEVLPQPPQQQPIVGAPGGALQASSAGGAFDEAQGDQEEEEEQWGPEAADARERLSGAEVVSVLLSLVALRVRPGPDWMEACLAALQPQLRALPPPMLLELAWALGRLRYQPARPWLAALLAALGAARAALSAQQLGLLAWALAAMQVKAAGALQNLISPHEAMVPDATAQAAAAAAAAQVDYAAGPAAARAVATAPAAAAAVAPGGDATGARAAAAPARGRGPARARDSGGGQRGASQDAAGAGAGADSGGWGAGDGQGRGTGGGEAGLQAKLVELMGGAEASRGSDTRPSPSGVAGRTRRRR